MTTSTIPLSRGYETAIDLIDMERVSRHKWRADVRIQKSGKVVVIACRTIGNRKVGYTSELLSRFIMNPPHGMVVDHIDGNTLNNVRNNLRICTQAQNVCNRGPAHSTGSKYKGVCWNKQAGKWTSQIKFNKRYYHLGYFDSEQDAAMQYNIAAKLHHGEFAYINNV